MQTFALNKWPVLRIFLILIGLLSGAFGGYVAYVGYHQRGILAKCIAGKACPYSYDAVTLQSLYSVSRAELDLGAVLAGVGFLIAIYAILFYFPRKAGNKSKVADEKLEPISSPAESDEVEK